MLAGFRCKGGRDGDLEGDVGWFSVDCGGNCDVEGEGEGGRCGMAVLIAS